MTEKQVEEQEAREDESSAGTLARAATTPADVTAAQEAPQPQEDAAPAVQSPAAEEPSTSTETANATKDTPPLAESEIPAAVATAPAIEVPAAAPATPAALPAPPPPPPLPFPVVTGNAFRLLGVSNAASRASLRSAVSALDRSARLGTTRTTPWDFGWLGELERTAPVLQEAQGRLGNVQRRLIERLFWFGPDAEDLDKLELAGLALAANLEGESVDARHDAALFKLLRAAYTNPKVDSAATWKEAGAAWKLVVEDDAYWARLLELEQEGRYEPGANAGDLPSIRRDAMRLALLPLVEAAREARDKNDVALAKRILTLFTELEIGEDVKFSLETDVLGPMEESVVNLARSIRSDCKVTRDQNAPAEVSKANRASCLEATQRFDKDVVPKLTALERLAGVSSVFTLRAKGAAAESLSGLATDWTWADDFMRSEALYKRAELMAAGTPALERIREERNKIAPRAQFQRDNVRSYDSVPTLTMNLYGWGRNILTWGSKYPYSSDINAEGDDTVWFYGTYYFMVFYIPLIPLQRYLVVRSPGGGWRIKARVNFSSAQWIHIGALVAAVAGFVLWVSG